MRRANLENTGVTFEFKGAKTAPKILTLSQVTPLKRANSAPIWATSEVEGSFLSMLISPPQSQIMLIHYILHLSNTHLFHVLKK